MVISPVGIIIAIVIMALVARGIAFSLADGQVFAAVGRQLRRLPPGLHKPLGTCGNCGVWFWGTPALWALNMLPDPLWVLPIYWLAAAGLQDLLDP